MTNKIEIVLLFLRRIKFNMDEYNKEILCTIPKFYLLEKKVNESCKGKKSKNYDYNLIGKKLVKDISGGI